MTVRSRGTIGLLSGAMALAACRSTPGSNTDSFTPLCPRGGTVIVRNEGVARDVYAIIRGGARELIGVAPNGRTTLSFDARVIRLVEPSGNNPVSQVRYEPRCN